MDFALRPSGGSRASPRCHSYRSANDFTSGESISWGTAGPEGLFKNVADRQIHYIYATDKQISLSVENARVRVVIVGRGSPTFQGNFDQEISTKDFLATFKPDNNIS